MKPLLLSLSSQMVKVLKSALAAVPLFSSTIKEVAVEENVEISQMRICIIQLCMEITLYGRPKIETE